jgi:hypothetical protein
MMNTPLDQLFAVKEPPFALPDGARIFTSVICEGCGEKTAENHIRLQGGEEVLSGLFLPIQPVYVKGAALSTANLPNPLLVD